MTNTPNMDLDLPIVQETLGPQYAEMNNQAFEDIDSHDHTSGKGVPIPAAAISIDGNLPFNGFAATELLATAFLDNGTDSTLDGSTYVKDGDLWYLNGDGTPVQITLDGAIAGTPGTISGLGDGGSSAGFTEATGEFTWTFDGSSLAAFNVGDLKIFPFDGLTNFTNFIRLQAPDALAVDYTLTLPATLPAAAALCQVSTAGILSYSNTLTDTLIGTIARMGTGSAAAPAYSFDADINLGLYRVGSDSLGISTGNFTAATFTTALTTLNSTTTNVVGALTGAGATFSGVLSVGNGTQALPSLTFGSDLNLGIYRIGADTLGISTGNFQAMSISSSAVTVGGSLNIAAGGAFKVMIFTGTAVPGNTYVLSTGGTSIYGVSGVYTKSSGTSTGVNRLIQLEDPGASAGAAPYFNGVASNTGNIDLSYNAAADANCTYRAIVFYI